MRNIDYTRLMIGDILMATYDDGEKVTTYPVVVDAIDSNTTLTDGSCYISWHPLLPEHKDIEDVDELDPIPLTEEILKANGFTIKSSDYSFIEIGNKIIISFHFGKTLRITDYNKGFEVGHAVKEIWHVHELQRALRCCGLWDMAEKFKIN